MIYPNYVGNKDGMSLNISPNWSKNSPSINNNLSWEKSQRKQGQTLKSFFDFQQKSPNRNYDEILIKSPKKPQYQLSKCINP